MCAHPARPVENENPLAAGKLAPALLGELLSALPTSDPALLLGPSLGEDAAVIELPGADQLLVAKSDPITFATDEIGYYAVNVCANDLAVTGAAARFYLPTILLPAGAATEAMVTDIFNQIGAACRALGIVVAGGHTEITHAVAQPVIAGTMLGQVAKGRQVSSGGARPGERVLLIGGAPVEGTSIIAREKRTELLARGWTAADLDRAADFLHNPGISVVAPALAAAENGLVSAMHDPTEGGVASGLRELALAANVGLEIDLDRIPVPDLAAGLCAAFELDPLGTIASGALLATAADEQIGQLEQALAPLQQSVSRIGRVLPADAGLRALRAGKSVSFPYFEVDEITRLFTS